jgi:hypothetical protein
MAKLAEFLNDAESSTPATDQQRRARREFINPKRVEIGLPPLEDDDDDIPELEFFERARERGMLRGGPRSARPSGRAVDVDRRVRGDEVPARAARHD